MTPAKLQQWQNKWKYATEKQTSDLFKAVFPNELSFSQRSTIQNFVKERIQNERATATRS